MDIAKITSRGGRRYNEDYIKYSWKRGMYIFSLADGLGGQTKGDIASQTACEAINREFELNAELDVGDYMETAQAAVKEKQKEMGGLSNMMTTAVVLKLKDTRAFVCHSGDSRLYYFKKNRIAFQTQDHSLVQALVDMRKIKKRDVRKHPDRSKVLYSLGSEWEYPQYDKAEIPNVSTGDVFLLCTDGWWELIKERQMTKSLKKARDMDEWVAMQKDIIEKNAMRVKNGENDNYSAIAIRI